MGDENFKSALKVQKGIEQPSSVSIDSVKKILRKQITEPDIEILTDHLLKGERSALGKAITLIESKLENHRTFANRIIEKCLPLSGKSMRIGITGVPGVGKSTFIEALGKHLTQKGHKVAVLAIDPSSERSKGSILGDKTRMEELANDMNAFIRPSPSAGSLGGVARKTRETIILCEAAGFDIILVETVGVGQSETAVHSMVDFFLLLMLAGAGDELQGIKRGIMEMSDALVINKADGNNIQKAQSARIEYQNALHLFPASESGWIPQATICSAYEKTGISEIWDLIENYKIFTRNNGYFELRRKKQEIQRMHEAIHQDLNDIFYRNDEIKQLIKELENRVNQNMMSSFQASQIVMDKFIKEMNK